MYVIVWLNPKKVGMYPVKSRTLDSPISWQAVRFFDGCPLLYHFKQTVSNTLKIFFLFFTLKRPEEGIVRIY